MSCPSIRPNFFWASPKLFKADQNILNMYKKPEFNTEKSCPNLLLLTWRRAGICFLLRWHCENGTYFVSKIVLTNYEICFCKFLAFSFEFAKVFFNHYRQFLKQNTPESGIDVFPWINHRELKINSLWINVAPGTYVAKYMSFNKNVAPGKISKN